MKVDYTQAQMKFYNQDLLKSSFGLFLTQSYCKAWNMKHESYSLVCVLFSFLTAWQVSKRQNLIFLGELSL